jgi:phage/plasmid primase-like uncharacterized protein/uncharacterized protein (DUF927 family)
MNHPHRSPSCQPRRSAPAPGSALDDALLEIRCRLGYAPQRLYETINGRPIRFGRGKSVPGWAFIRNLNGAWFVYYGDWRTGEQYTWTSHGQHELPAAERRRLEEDVRRLLNEEKLKQEDQRAAAARSVQAQWENLPPAPADHPYLMLKQVRPHGIRIKAGSLVVPLRDIAGQLWSWQTIDAEGRKRFYKGGRAKGLFFTFAQPGQLEAANTILIGEGWATGATLHETLGLPVVAAMNASNLLPVVQALHEKYPHHRLVICADDDWHGKGDSGNDNAGLTEARKAAAAVGGQVAVPVWSGKRGEKDTDFNDLALSEGRAAVRRILEAVLAAPDETTSSVPGVPDSPGAPDDKAKAPDKAAPGPEKAEDKAPGKGNALRQSPRPGENERSVPAVEPAGQDAGSILQPVRPGLDERPCYWLLEEPAVIGGRQYQAGVYHCGIKHEKQCGELAPAPTETWLCSPIRLLARTIEWPDGAQGVRLAVWDGRGWRDAVLPREALASRRYREILYGRGAQLTPENRPELAGYLQQDTASREYVTSRAGWHGEQYVLPDTTIGRGPTISFTGLRFTNEPLTAGGLEDWRRSVAALAAGNPLLVLSVSLPFVGPLLKLTERNAVLVHLVGRSTTGKTTCLLAANSVVGPPELTTTWRATADGLEQRALAHCDGFLALDEVAQVDAKVLDHAVYTLANGAAKQRATVYENGVGAAPMQRWRVAALSSGEKTMETLLSLDKGSLNAGQAVRFIEVPVAERYGAFAELHGHGSGAALADALRRAVRQYYGTAFRAFLEQLVCDDMGSFDLQLSECVARLRRAVESDRGAPVGPQASRVMASMGLIALAGEMASRYGITGWQRGAAFDAALHCYRLWSQGRAAGTDFEAVSLIRQVYDFTTRYSDSRFSPVDVGSDRPGGKAGTVRAINPVVHHRAGWYRDLGNGDREYLFTHDGFRAATRGFDFRRARQELLRLGVLIPGKDRDSQSVRIGFGPGRVRVYVVSFGALNDALEQVGGGE